MALLYVANFDYKYNSKFYKLPYQILANLRREFDKKMAFLNICPFNTNKEYIGLIKNNEKGVISNYADKKREIGRLYLKYLQ